MKLIDKDKVVAEMGKRKSELQLRIAELGTFESNALGLFQDVDLYDDILSYIDTLETKDVGLENLFQALPETIADEKSHQVYQLSIYHYDGQCVVDYVGEIDGDSLYTFCGSTLYETIEKAWNWLYKNSTGG